VSYFPDLAFPGAADKIEALTRVAKSQGVRKLVLLSGRGEAHARHCEEIVRNSRSRFHAGARRLVRPEFFRRLPCRRRCWKA
jgi:hypothetical protein